MYRILAANQPVRERRNQLTHRTTPSPSWWRPGEPDLELGHHAPAGAEPWTYFYLYVLLDIFSRYVVGWMVAERENSALAATLIEQTCPSSRHRTPDAHPAFGSRRADDQQVHRTTARRPRG